MALVSVLLLLAATTGPATAASATTKSNTDTYSRSGYQVFTGNGECVKYTITGKISYVAHKGPKDGSVRTYWLTGIKLKDPKISVQAVKYDTVTHGCTTRKATFKSLGVRQMFKGYSCSFNPSISVEAPFGVGASFWPTCGTKAKKSAQYGFTFKNDDNGTMLRPGTRVGFANNVLGQYTKAPKTGTCYGAVVKLSIYTGSTNSSPKYSGRHKICLTPSFK